MIDSVLTVSGIQSPAWKKIEVWAESRVAAHHKKLELNVGIEDTSTLRGSIKELRNLLQLGKSVAPPHVSDTANESIPSVIF
jgi:hypothetical protein